MALPARVAFAVFGLPGAAHATEAPADPWPRQFKAGNATILVYQPQVESWTDNVLTFRSAIGIRKSDPKDDAFGVIFAKARTQVDKASRIVLLEDAAVTKRSFPTLPDHGLLYLISLKTQLGRPSGRCPSTGWRRRSPPPARPRPRGAVGNEPPRILVSETPAVLVRIGRTARTASAGPHAVPAGDQHDRAPSRDGTRARTTCAWATAG
jgi:hypothetical protein